MANSSQKKIAHENNKILLSLRKGFIWVNAFYILYRIVYHWSTFSTKLAVSYILTAGLSIVLYSQIHKIGQPRYNSKGELHDAGMDLTQEGLVQYIPLYATWKGYELAIKPMLGRTGGLSGLANAAASGSGEPVKSKRREKMEKRAEKGPQIRYR
ncbi:hypothetical protein BGW41_007801 [Actinomortierella wolfii]|nr:hypothetical protein BGW41_007801 [Actinomortierella wolfii]